MVEVIDFLRNAVLESERKAHEYNKPVKRDLYKEISAKPNIHIIYGLRGGGKTTLLFQKYLSYQKGKRLYITGDELNFLRISLYDIFKNIHYVLEAGESALFIDEVTKIDNWATELKIGSDANPKLNIYVSGSSAINLLDSKKELARRAQYHHLLPMTFREYIKITKGIELEKFDFDSKDVYTQIIRYDIYFKGKIKGNPIDILNDYWLKNHPFLLEANEEMLFDLIEKIIYEDISKVYKFDQEILGKFERLLFLLCASEKVTYENLSKDLLVSKAIVGKMLRALLQSGLIKQVLPYGSGRVVGRKTWRYFFVIPSVRKIYLDKGGAEASKIRGYTLEDLFISGLENVFYLESGPDFIYNGKTIEVGSQNKGIKQIKDLTEGFVVYNGLEISKNCGIIKFPLYIFLAHL